MEPGPTSSALQCCLICGRTLTDRDSHDKLEESVLRTIRAEHPEWIEVNGACEACIFYYRKFLKERATREETVRIASRWHWPKFVVAASQKVVAFLR
jgi:hypothetical protein